jgi:hypothetical protein
LSQKKTDHLAEESESDRPESSHTLEYLMMRINDPQQKSDGTPPALPKQRREARSLFRGELFPMKIHNKKWVLKEVVDRIDEYSKLPDAYRPESRNVRYCSPDRPRKVEDRSFFVHTHPAADQMRRNEVRPSLLQPLQRGATPEIGMARGGRSESKFARQFPLLEERRKRLMDAIPHRAFGNSCSAQWMVSNDVRSQLQRKYHCCEPPQNNAWIQQMATIALKQLGGNEKSSRFPM